MNIVLIYHICDVIKRMRKYAWFDVSRSSIRFTYSSVARHIGPCICHNSQTYTWNDVIPYKGRTIRVFYNITTFFSAVDFPDRLCDSGVANQTFRYVLYYSVFNLVPF